VSTSPNVTTVMPEDQLCGHVLALWPNCKYTVGAAKNAIYSYGRYRVDVSVVIALLDVVYRENLDAVKPSWRRVEELLEDQARKRDLQQRPTYRPRKDYCDGDRRFLCQHMRAERPWIGELLTADGEERIAGAELHLWIYAWAEMYHVHGLAFLAPLPKERRPLSNGRMPGAIVPSRAADAVTAVARTTACGPETTRRRDTWLRTLAEEAGLAGVALPEVDGVNVTSDRVPF
jgi:hypothetical protein